MIFPIFHLNFPMRASQDKILNSHVWEKFFLMVCYAATLSLYIAGSANQVEFFRIFHFLNFTWYGENCQMIFSPTKHYPMVVFVRGSLISSYILFSYSHLFNRKLNFCQDEKWKESKVRERKMWKVFHAFSTTVCAFQTINFSFANFYSFSLQLYWLQKVFQKWNTFSFCNIVIWLIYAIFTPKAERLMHHEKHVHAAAFKFSF